ncbi:MAG: hypothetical protein ABR936_15215 [Bacteroidota bacterium]|jgi:hypothetical protein
MTRKLTISGALVLFFLGLALLLFFSPPVKGYDVYRLLGSSIGIILCSSAAVGFVYEVLIREQMTKDIEKQIKEIFQIDTFRLGIKGAFLKRGDISNFRWYVDETTDEFIASGISLTPIATTYRDDILKMLRRGVRCKFLISSPDSFVPKQHSMDIGFSENAVREHIKNFHDVFSSIARAKKEEGFSGQFELRYYDSLPYVGICCSDRKKLIATLYIFGRNGTECPCLELENKPNGLFEELYNAFFEQWQKGKIVEKK